MKNDELLNEKLYWKVVFVMLVICGGLFVFEYAYLSQFSDKVLGMDWNWGWAAFFCELLYLAASFKIVGPTELGAILLFGNPIKAVGSGLVFAPLWILSLDKESRLVIQSEYPADPENVWKGDEDERPSDKFPPIRITHAKASDNDDDPINERMTTEVSFFVRYRIMDFIIFLTTIGSVAEAEKQIQDTLVATASQQLAKKTPAEALRDWADINAELKSAVDKLTDSWGIKVEDSQMKAIDLGKTVNSALRDVPAEELAKKVTITKAEAEKRKMELEGEGKATAEKAFLVARAGGYQEVAKKLKLEGDKVLTAETAKAAFENADYAMFGGYSGFQDILKTIAAGQNITPKMKKAEA
jgi:regulator of protease activity HflC (stomatin/prohibitin superfamily)